MPMDSGKKRKTRNRRYLSFGILSLAIGGFFMALTFLATTTAAKILLAGFFFIIGVIDTVLYSVFGKR